MSKKRAYVETYGCQMNISDGELMSGLLTTEGYEIVSSPQDADVVLVNTCAIREHAEQRVLGRVAQLNSFKEENPELVIGVTGCMAQRMGSDLLGKAPHVELVIGPDGYRGLTGALRELRPGEESEAPSPTPQLHDTSQTPLIQLGTPGRRGGKGTAQGTRQGAGQGTTLLELSPHENYEGLEVRRGSSVSGWVSIQRGCDHRCTFCIVPYVRGGEKNREPQGILSEIRQAVENGIRDVTLLGQTVNSYRSGDWDFPRLLEAVARVDGIRRVRFTSPHPNDVTPALTEVMAREEAVCEQLHLPLQAGNDRTLKRMLRRHTVADFREKVRLVRDAIPQIALSTDIIVGFPGESEQEFRDTLSVVQEIRFDDAFTYRYSPREGTPATRLPPEEFIPGDEGKARLEALIKVTRGIQKEINEGEVGSMVEVLVEKEGKEPGFMLGRTRRNKAVVFPGDSSMRGSFRKVEITRTTGATFVGALIDPPAEREP